MPHRVLGPLLLNLDLIDDDDDVDDDDDDDELFLWYDWPTKRVQPAETIDRDLHHRESPTRGEQDLNLRRTWVQVLLNEPLHPDTICSTQLVHVAALVPRRLMTCSLNGRIITSYADGTTPFSCAQDMPSVIFELQRFAKKIFDWYNNNHMKANPEKCHAMLSSNTQGQIWFDNTSID